MFIIGQKVVCIDGKFDPIVAQWYACLPKEGSTYTIRGIMPGTSPTGEDEIAVYLQEMVNPRSSIPPHRERGFKVERFQPLEELTEQEILNQHQPQKEHAHT